MRPREVDCSLKVDIFTHIIGIVLIYHLYNELASPYFSGTYYTHNYITDFKY